MNPSFARAFAAGEDLSPWKGSGVFKAPAPGCLLYEESASSVRGLLLSCGIHGDETGPIELLDRLIAEIRAGELVPSVRVMFVVGNPSAIAAGKRFIEHDMNRLFDGQWAAKDGLAEARRARDLEEVTSAFVREVADVWHLDLHTTIRPSRIERFAIANVVSKAMLPDDLWDFLRAASAGAVVFRSRSRGTYSAFSSRLPGMASLTLELGQGKRFGENAPQTTADFERALRCWLKSEPLPTAPVIDPACYEVTREILRGNGTFAFHLPAETQNFTPLEPGQVLAEGASGKFVAEEGEFVLFPNPNVAVGLRAAVLVRQCPAHPVRGD
jgi:succinylglutamate desuccinylase